MMAGGRSELRTQDFFRQPGGQCQRTKSDGGPLQQLSSERSMTVLSQERTHWIETIELAQLPATPEHVA